MKQNEGTKEQLPPTLVDHPQGDLLFPGPLYTAAAGRATAIRERPLQALQPPSFSLVALKVTWLWTACVGGHIWMLVHVDVTAIGEVKTRRAL